MLIFKMWNYILSYVIIIVKGRYPEKLINYCARRGILLWDIKYNDDSTIYTKIRVKSFFKLKPLLKKADCNVHIIEKHGIRFFLYKNRKRKAFMVGVILFIFMITFLSSFVWEIDIKGNTRISKEQITQTLERLGLKVGAWKPLLDVDELIYGLEINMKDLSWASIDITGTKAEIEVAERKEQKRYIEFDKPVNIIAKKNGLIYTLIVEEGTPVVKNGSNVLKGELLVSGIVVNKYEKVRNVHSLAIIKARTWYEKKIVMPYQIKELKRCGFERVNYKFYIFDKFLNLNIKPEFPIYDNETKNYSVTIGENNILPLGVISEVYYQKQSQTRILTSVEAKKIAIEKGLNEIKKLSGSEALIVNKKITAKYKKDCVVVNILIECNEDIGQETPIDN